MNFNGDEDYSRNHDGMAQFLNLYITEDSLNTYIKEIKDLSVLTAVLEVKSRLISQEKHALISFPIETILNEVSSLRIDEVCLVLRLALVIQSNNLQYEILLDYINKNCIDINDSSSLECVLKLFQVAINLCDLKSRRKVFDKFAATNQFQKVICSLLTVESRNIINFITVHILPFYLKGNCFGSSYILNFIWENTQKSKDLSMLCSLSQFFLPWNTSSSCILCLVNLDEFWFLLQDCLTNSNSIIQKQALYLLNQALYAVKDEEDFTTETKIIAWNRKCKVKTQIAMQNLCILFDISREKQLHLIEPSYQLLPTTKILHSSWLMCIYKILLAHSHNAVSSFAICDIFKSNQFEDVNTFKMIIQYLLPVLNKVEFTDRKEIWNGFYQFNERLNSEQITLLLEQSIKVTWIPSICYQFYSNLLHCISKRNYQSDNLFSIIENITTGFEKLPHKFIRRGCIDLIVEFVERQLSCNKFDFNNYKIINQILKRCNRNNLHILLQNKISEYDLSSEKLLEKLCNSKNACTEEIEIVFEIIKLVPNLHEAMFKLFIERKFNLKIADRVCMILYEHKQYRKPLFPYIIKRLNNLCTDDDGIIIDLFKLFILTNDDETEMKSLSENCMKILFVDRSNSFEVHIAFEIVNTLLEQNKCSNIVLDKIDDILSLWKEKFLKGIKNSSANICVLFLYLYCNKEFFKSSFSAAEQQKLITSEKVLDIITLFEKIMDTESNIVVPIIFDNLKYLFNLCDDVEDVLNFVDICVNKLLEIRRTDQFKNAIENFIQSMFSNSKVSDNNEAVINKCTIIAWHILEFAKTSDDAAYSLAKHLRCLFDINPRVIIKFVPIIVELLLFGDILKKDQRAEYIICQKIDTDEGRIVNENNPNFRRLSVRGQAIVIINNTLNLLLEDEKTKIVDKMISLLIEKYNVHFNRRYFAHSKIHMQKLRILQAILTVHNYVKSQKQALIDLLIDSLCTESHQVSVKFFIQWILIGLLCYDNQSLSIIRSKVESTSKVHSSTIIAFVPILYHIALWRNDEEFWMNLFEIMLPWTMGAHFNLRLYAQEGIKKLYEVAYQTNLSLITKTFQDSVDCITKVLDRTERKIDVIDQYVFNDFNAVDNYCLVMIYYYIPKFTNVTLDEYENFLNIPEFVNDCKGEIISNIEPYLNSYTQISVKSSEDDLLTNLIQKKITPWMESFKSENSNKKIGSLVVVASLINKTPNLGGLSRTCEIFGVKQLVISSLNIIKDHEFQSVSMSSENWVDISEIKIDNLQSYLLEMKQKGYVVVGAEQTSDSVTLNTFQFPKECVLLLGNEKEGIPPNLLTLIDFCVEIPQFGVVRSLNVHVAAATFIWEYTKQHVA
ncbi:hypothetical protein ILUMI_05791 [Ignelater luminosus]|uniref:tRNA (guanosine(18)-2'-O)-methyltransferase TARBP1 n=1 Tax=Ignelater luminosus TaxID=2038154 RepID=A0A8K0DCC7_IGNLU|nr:hypothetical protein ILUMI_05791 [Ignelater luminosus]